MSGINALTIAATGGTAYGPGYPILAPDGGELASAYFGARGGISTWNLPVDSLIGIFLGDQVGPAPGPYSAPLDQPDVTPALGQVFFIGDGLIGHSSGAPQNFVVPEGATRLFLASTDGYGWFDNTGSFRVDVQPQACIYRPDPNFIPGRLSERFESGGRGPGTISTGRGDPGGVSYGLYQFSSRRGTVQDFVNRYYPTEFGGLRPATPAFNRQWRNLAATDPANFGVVQRRYVRDTIYAPAVQALEANPRLGLKCRSNTLRDVLWSTAVHHGPTGSVTLIRNALQPLLVNGQQVDNIDDQNIIRAIYRERGRTRPNGTLVYFPKVSRDVRHSLLVRFESEQAQALSNLVVAAGSHEG